MANCILQVERVKLPDCRCLDPFLVGLFWLRLGWHPEPVEAADDNRPQLLDFESFTFTLSLAILRPIIIVQLNQHNMLNKHGFYFM